MIEFPSSKRCRKLEGIRFFFFICKKLEYFLAKILVVYNKTVSNCLFLLVASLRIKNRKTIQCPYNAHYLFVFYQDSFIPLENQSVTNRK